MKLKAENFRPELDFTPLPLRYLCGALVTELSIQLENSDIQTYDPSRIHLNVKKMVDDCFSYETK